jgi:Poly(ADP-ribose) polymerase catalytic domain
MSTGKAMTGTHSLQLVKLERVQNTDMWLSYEAMRKHVLTVKYATGAAQGRVKVNAAAPGDGEPVERALWHGTRSLPPHDLASTDVGWCASYAAPGSFGKGSYFATDPNYSLWGYAFGIAGGEKQLILADVLTGETASPSLLARVTDPVCTGLLGFLDMKGKLDRALGKMTTR